MTSVSTTKRQRFIVAGLLLLLTLALCNQYTALGGFTIAFQGALKKVLLAGVVFGCALLLDEHRLERLIPALYLLSLSLLILVAINGRTIKGSTRWVQVAGITLQPTELAKIFTPLMSSHLIYLTRDKHPYVILVGVLFVCFFPAVLILKQPDLGSTILLISGSLLPLLVSPIPWRYFAQWISAVFLLLPLGWQFLYPYQKNRILTLFNGQQDLLGQGYHIHQSKIAIGSGGMWGKGWGQNTQAAYRFLPEHDTDFAFALFAEEWGLAGVALVIGLFYAVIHGLLFSTLTLRSYYAQLICYALVAPLFLSVFINIGMISGLLPVVGVPLPLFSRGGTYLISFAFSLGLTSSLSWRSAVDPTLRG